MKNKLKFLIKHSLSKKIGTKWFKVINILLLVLMIAMANIDRLITFFGGDFSNENTIYVVDNTNSAKDSFENYFNVYAENLEDFANYKVKTTNDDIKNLEEKIKETDDIIVKIETSEENYVKSEIITYEVIDTITYQLLSAVLNNVKSEFVIANSGMSAEEINALTSNIEIDTTATNPDLDENAEAKDIISAGLIIIFIVPFFLFIVLLTQMIGAEINDEKSTKSMEIIISNVPPKYHFISKIIASSMFVIIQGALLFLYGIIAFLIRNLLGATMASSSINSDVTKYITDIYLMLKNSGVISLLVQGLPFIIILFIFNILAYAIIAGVLASMTTNIEDYQQLQSPIMIIMMIGYYIALMASTFEGSVFVSIVSFIPLFSALVAPVLYLLGQTTLLSLIASTIISIITVYVLYVVGLRIYKVGILNYSSSDLWKKVFKSIKNK